ncbi:MAG TPA: MoaD/ThiS family protein [Candidatus Cryosericum sp.]|nr:MoaD/ThiS family protein [Candidatus Cryosericum sp.]
MIVRVLLFARYREAAGCDTLEVEVPRDATLEVVWEVVRASVPALGAERAPLMALDRAYAAPHRAVSASDEVAFFPPVSGG